MKKDTSLVFVTVADAKTGDKLNLPHGSTESDSTDVLDVQSAHVMLGPSNTWLILLVLKSGRSFTIKFTVENVDRLVAIGISVDYPMGPPQSTPSGSKPSGSKLK